MQSTVRLPFREGIRELGLALGKPAARFQARVQMVRAAGTDLPDLSDTALLETLEDWLAPYLTGLRSAEDWRRRLKLAPLGGDSEMVCIT